MVGLNLVWERGLVSGREVSGDRLGKFLAGLYAGCLAVIRLGILAVVVLGALGGCHLFHTLFLFTDCLKDFIVGHFCNFFHSRAVLNVVYNQFANLGEFIIAHDEFLGMLVLVRVRVATPNTDKFSTAG